MEACREYDFGGWGCALISFAGGFGGGWAVWQCNGTGRNDDGGASMDAASNWVVIPVKVGIPLALHR